jgi:hypothetical protein
MKDGDGERLGGGEEKDSMGIGDELEDLSLNGSLEGVGGPPEFD